MDVRGVVLALVGVSMVLALGCNGVLGLGDYKVSAAQDGSSLDEPEGGQGASLPSNGDADCDAAFGLDGCYACTPQTNSQLLNACTASACVPFNDGARLKNWDGGALPTVPAPIDGGPG